MSAESECISDKIVQAEGRGSEAIRVRTQHRLRPVRLLLLTRNLGLGGAERQLVTLGLELDKKRFDVNVLTLYADGDLREELTRGGVRVYSLNKTGRWDLHSISLRLGNILRRLRPDIVYSFLTGQNLLALMAKAFLPGPRIVWGVRSSILHDQNRDWLSRVSCAFERKLSRVPDLIIFNSNAAEAYHAARGFVGRRVAVIHNGIDTRRFCPDWSGRAIFRARWGIPDDSLVIGIVGRLDPLKDHETFFRAAELFSRSRSESRFVCIGGGPEKYHRELRDLCSKCGLADRVTWTGPLLDMRVAYNALDICCSSSLGEGMQNSIAEAMACGVPCVVTDVGDSALVVGDTGVGVPPRSPEALAKGWLSLADRLRHDPQIGAAARKRIETLFSIKSLVSRTAEALASTL